jgi:hypothetical protein
MLRAAMPRSGAGRRGAPAALTAGAGEAEEEEAEGPDDVEALLEGAQGPDDVNIARFTARVNRRALVLQNEGVEEADDGQGELLASAALRLEGAKQERRPLVLDKDTADPRWRRLDEGPGTSARGGAVMMQAPGWSLPSRTGPAHLSSFTRCGTTLVDPSLAFLSALMAWVVAWRSTTVAALVLSLESSMSVKAACFATEHSWLCSFLTHERIWGGGSAAGKAAHGAARPWVSADEGAGPRLASAPPSTSRPTLPDNIKVSVLSAADPCPGPPVDAS